VDDSLLPIFSSLIKTENSISKIMEENKKSVETVLAQYSKINEQLIQKINGTIKTHNYADAKGRTVLMARWGWGLWLILILILSPGFVWVYNEYLSKGMKYKALENVIIYDPETKQYYIESKDYRTQNNKILKGIVIKIKE
jgi:hypothetical protein